MFRLTAGIGEGSAQDWLDSIKVNVFGTYGIIHAALPELKKTKGQIVFTSSSFAHMRGTVSSDYAVRAHRTLNERGSNKHRVSSYSSASTCSTG